MTDIDGTWNIVIKSPAGDQKGVLTVQAAGATFAGQFSSDEGALDIDDGTVDGDTIGWTMKITKPMPMTLTCSLTHAGDALTGTVTAGPFGKFPMTGTRA